MGTGESRESPAELRDCPLRDYSYCAIFAILAWLANDNYFFRPTCRRPLAF
jgi:hypothetical protein